MGSVRLLMAVLLTSLSFSISSCKREEKFPTIADNVASPVDVGVSADGSHFYVLNADLDRTYNQGSILVIDSDGNKVNAIETPRLGRHMNIAGNVMVVGYEAAMPDEQPMVRLFDLSDPTAPTVKKEFTLDCSPINAAVRANYDYFAVNCLCNSGDSTCSEAGNMYVGQLNRTDLSQSSLRLVRTYGRPYHAMHIDTARNLLYTFPTIYGSQNRIFDTTFTDKEQYDQTTDQLVEGANEAPDTYEVDALSRDKFLRNRRYQFVVYDLAAEEAKGWPYLSSYNADNDVLAKLDLEHRWLYFTLLDSEGNPESSAGNTEPDLKHYRTNFWEAKSDPDNEDVFYLSQRSHPDGNYETGNNIIKVTTLADPRATDGQTPETADILSFERIYGFSDDLRGVGDEEGKVHFPGDFERVNVGGEDVLLVNHFRDLVYFTASERFYSVAATTTSGTPWREEISSESATNSYYQIAANDQGKMITGSFYGNAVILLEVQPGTGITELQRIE